MTGVREDKRRLAPSMVANSAVQIVGLLASFLISLVTFAAITRHLGPTKFGYYSAALALLLIPNTISDLGLSKTVLRRISRQPELSGEVVSAGLTVRTLVSLVAFPVTLALAFVVPLPDGTRMAALVASVGSFVMVLNDGLLSVLQAELRMRWATTANILGRALTLGLTLVAFEFGRGLYAVLLAYIAGNALTLLVDFLAVRGVGLRPFLDLRYCRRLARSSLVIGASVIMGSLYFRIDVVLLAALRPSSDVGLYSSAYKFLDLSLLVGSAITVSIFPHLSREMVKKTVAKAHVQHIFNVLLAFGTAIAVVVGMHAKHLIVLTSGDKYLPATSTLQILAPAITVSLIAGLFGAILLAGDRERLLLLVHSTMFAVNVGLNLALIPPYGYNAAAATTLASGVAWTFLTGLCIHRAFGIIVSPSFVPQVAAAAGAMAAVLAFCPGPWVLVEALAGLAFVLVLVVLPGPGSRYVGHLVEPVLGRGRFARKSVAT